jgi:hypothetical protein
MKQLERQQTERFIALAKRQTSVEKHADDWDPSYICGNNCEDCYELGMRDAEIHYARFILDLLDIEYK